MRTAAAAAAAAAAVALLAAPVAAQNAPPLVTDRPDQTESPVVVPRGMVQLEAGTLHEVAGSGEGRVTSVASLLARAGLYGPIELRLGFLGWQRATGGDADARTGFGDLSVGVKVALLEGRGLKPGAAVLASALVPVGDEEFRAGGADPDVRVALAHELGGAFSLGYNVGAAWITTPDDTGTEATHFEGLYTLTLGRGFGPRIGAFVEAFGHVAPSDGNPSGHALDGGVTFGVKSNVQLDATVGVGLDGVSPAWFVGLGVSARIPR
jgi:hypothetical protein